MANDNTTQPAPTTWFKTFLTALTAVFAGLLGYLLWQVTRYGQRLWRQPRYIYDLPVSEDASDEELQMLGLLVATANVRSCIEKRLLLNGEEKWVLCAGSRNFREPWARDFSFASYGLMEMEETPIIREGLEVFFIYQRPDGQFPVKVHSTGIVDRYLHSLFKRQQPIAAPIKPKFVTAHNTISLDGNGLLVIAALNYVEHSGDYDFGHTHWPALKRAVAWMESHAVISNGLLRQGPYTDWADSIARRGRILYTNVIYWKSLHELARAAARYGDHYDQEIYTARADLVRQAIHDHFWREERGYFITSQRHRKLSSAGNLMAIAWDLATEEQAHSILDTMEIFGLADPIPTQVTHRAYPRHYVGLENRLAGIIHYHSRAAWLWIGAWHVIALARLERVEEAKVLLNRIDETIARDGVVHEVYGPAGHHLSTRWYTSEAPLSWSAAMVIYAHHVLRRHEA